MAYTPSVMIGVEIMRTEYVCGKGNVETWAPVGYSIGGMESQCFYCAWEAPAAEDVQAAGATQAAPVAIVRMAYHPEIYAAASENAKNVRILLGGNTKNAYRLVASAENVGMNNTEMVMQVKRWDAR